MSEQYILDNTEDFLLPKEDNYFSFKKVQVEIVKRLSAKLALLPHGGKRDENDDLKPRKEPSCPGTIPEEPRTYEPRSKGHLNLAPPLLVSTRHSHHPSSTWRFFSGTRLELMTRPSPVGYSSHMIAPSNDKFFWDVSAEYTFSFHFAQ
ncbi:hypothetical protein TNCV_4888761 [Trichonephila clavipes]|nr:hypothetical protein TNCV_4888761 [Trichonephila clavipes]